MLSLKDPYHLVGRILSGKYRIDALVGIGGMGAVYCAYQLTIDRRIAFKILQPNVAVGDEHVVEMFEREARLAGRLAHENIVDVKDAGHTEDGIAYIVMEWLDGRTLDDEILAEGRIDFDRAAGIARQIASALAAAHANHIIHRDLKPGNVMLVTMPDGRERVKVLDFGIAKALSHTSGTPVSSIVGTPHYASPEQLNVGGRIDHRSDIYSFGIILYRMLSGRTPYNCNSIGELIQLQMTSPPKPLGELRPEIPQLFQELVGRMVSIDPEKRPQDIQEVIRYLDQILKQSEYATLETAALPKAEHTGDTTIQRKRIPDGETTEEMPEEVDEFATTVIFESKSMSRPNSKLIVPALTGVLFVAAGYGIYRFAFDRQDQIRSSMEGGQAAASIPSPTETAAPVVNATPATALAKPSVTPNRIDDNEAGQNQPRRLRLAEAHYNQAVQLSRQGKRAEALRKADEALKLNPKHSEARALKRKLAEMLRILNN